MTLHLFGDSVFDNAVYVPDPEFSVKAMLEKGGWGEVQLWAVDGSVTEMVADQIESAKNLIQKGDTAFLSSGGNDLLMFFLNFLNSGPLPPLGLIELLDKPLVAFREDYVRIVDALCASPARVVLTTIYRSNMAESLDRAPDFGVSLLAMANGIIWEQAACRELAVLDANTLLRDRDDFTNVIEPSHQGGKKLVQAMAQLVKEGAQ